MPFAGQNGPLLEVNKNLKSGEDNSMRQAMAWASEE
jgi:hypothetical protein